MRSDKRGIIVRKIAILSSVVLLAFAVGCGGSGGSGTPSGIQISVAVSASASSVNPGGTVTLTATVTNDSSNKGVSWSLSPSTGEGALSNQTTTSATYTAPTTVPTATSVTITATSNASSSATASVQVAVQTSAVTVSLSPAAPQTVDQGGTVSISATLTNDTSNAGVTWALSGPAGASLSGQTTTAATFNAPTSVTSNTAYTVTATSKSSTSATAAVEITVFPSGAGSNVAALNVNSGPAGNSTNLAFVSVTVCEPGTTICQTIDNIQVDTGSEGLRILQSAMGSLTLPTLTDTSGNTIDNCVSFLDTSYLWGPVQEADIKIAGEVASSALLQSISSSNSGIPTACTNGGTVNENTPTLLGANGILGVGTEPTDCVFAGSDFCDGSVSSSVPPIYFSCPSSGCATTASPIFETESDQVVNPVVLFGTDSNGVVINFPALTGSAASLTGSMTFGIATESNNGLGTATTFTLDVCDTFETQFDGQSLINNTNCNGPGSFIDSGSNALYFPVLNSAASMPACSSSTPLGDLSGFYCPAGLTPFTATDVDTNFGTNKVVSFSVDNAQNLFTNNPTDFAFGTLGGTNTGGGFDWGLPFFFGRTVYTAIDGQVVSTTTGPFWAF